MQKKSKLPSRMPHKHFAKRCKVKNISFPSKLEGKCYALLEDWKTNGKLLFTLRQVGFDLPAARRHFVDFAVFGKDNMIFVEAKGRDLAAGKAKREMAEQLYGVKIHVVKSTNELLQLCVKEVF